MNAGDQVEIQLDYSSELGGTLHVSDFSNLSIVFLAVPEPSGLALAFVALVGTPILFRRAALLQRTTRRTTNR